MVCTTYCQGTAAKLFHSSIRCICHDVNWEHQGHRGRNQHLISAKVVMAFHCKVQLLATVSFCLDSPQCGMNQ